MSQIFLLSRLFKIALAIVLFTGFSYTSVQAQLIQVGDFRIGPSDLSADTAFDPGAAFGTRDVAGAPFQINSAFSVGSQESADATVDPVTDVILNSFTPLLRIRNLNRFKPNPDGTAGVQRIGIAQWNFDLSLIDTFLASNPTESLQALDLDLLTVNSDVTTATDVYLSYTLPSAGIVLTGINSTTATAGADNYANFFLPAQGAIAGDVVNGTHQVLRIGAVADQTLNESLLALYNAGVREFNLTLASNSFLSARTIDVLEGSGISFATEPTGLVLLGDVDMDGDVDFGDIPAFIAVLQSGVFQAEADCDESGAVGFSDIPAFIDILLES